ncbi:MAG: cupin domain-containing protein [Halioglobus sp.]
MSSHFFHHINKIGKFGLTLAALAILAGCANTQKESGQDTHVVIDKTLSADDIDPEIYFNADDPADPFASVYSGFRDRRAQDMADESKPPPIAAFPSVHLSQTRAWKPLEATLPFNWAAIYMEAPQEALQLEEVVKARVALDHPDVKIVELMIGPGATLPGHAGGAPGFYYVVGGSGEITVEDRTQTVSPGTTVKLHPYDVRRIYADTSEPLKIVWVRWAPGGDQQYLAAGYYLTGANQHVQPQQAELPWDFHFWDNEGETRLVENPQAAMAVTLTTNGTISQQDSRFRQDAQALDHRRKTLGDQRALYPNTPMFSHESDYNWIDEETIKGSGFFWAKDVSQLGALLQRWGDVMRLKGFFRASRADGGWDFNISQMAWGPRSRYVEHSHSIPEFYYMLSGPVEHWVGDRKYIARAGDIFLTNSYQTHQSRGIVNGLTFRNIGASWAPNGDRGVFARPFYLVEPLPQQPASARLGSTALFHAEPQ